MNCYKFPSIHIAIALSLLFFPSFLQAGIVVVNGLTHLYEVVPGEVYRGVIELQNTKEKDQPVKLYQQDFHFNFKGEAFYEEPGSLGRSNAAWISVSPKYLILKGKEKTKISFEIKVPVGVPLTGTYWSVIMVEGEAPIDKDHLNKGLTIQTQLRYAVQIATTLGKSGERNLTFLDVNPVKEEGKWQLAVDIENQGDVLFKPAVTVELFDELGNQAGVFTAANRKLYPKTSSRFLLPLDGVKPGTYQVLILADCGEEDVFGINHTVDLKDD